VKRPSKAVLAVCHEIEGDGSRDNIEQTVYAAEQIVELRKMIALAAELLAPHETERTTVEGSRFLAFAKRTRARFH
jgi:hypothetical protein